MMELLNESLFYMDDFKSANTMEFGVFEANIPISKIATSLTCYIAIIVAVSKVFGSYYVSKRIFIITGN